MIGTFEFVCQAMVAKGYTRREAAMGWVCMASLKRRDRRDRRSNILDDLLKVRAR